MENNGRHRKAKIGHGVTYLPPQISVSLRVGGTASKDCPVSLRIDGGGRGDKIPIIGLGTLKI